MSQLKSGLVTVTNGATLVTSSGAQWSSVKSGDLFALHGSNVWYQVAGPATQVSNQWRLSLTVAYSGVTASDKEYLISTSFTPTYQIPYPEQGDTQSASLIKRAFLLIDGIIRTSTLTEDSRRSLALVGNESVGAAYGFEQVSSAQTGTAPALRLFASSQNSARIAFGKYTDATAFDTYAEFLNDGVLTVKRDSIKVDTASVRTFTFPASSGQLALQSELHDAAALTGTLPVNTFPTVWGLAPATYGSAIKIPVIGVDQYGRISSITTADIGITPDTATGANLGAGVSVYAQKTGSALQFRTLLAGTGISVSQNATTLTITNTLPDVNAWMSSRSVANHVYNVLDYGAVQGSTDSLAGIQAAISACAAAGGGTVLVPAGSYRSSGTLDVDSPNIFFSADGAVIQKTVYTNGPLFNVHASNIAMRGITLDGAKVDAANPNTADWFGLIQLYDSSGAISNFSLERCTLRNTNSTGLHVFGNVSRVTVADCSFSWSFINVFVEPSGGNAPKDIYIKDNRFSNNWVTGAYSGAVKVKADYDTGLAVTGIHSTGNTIDGCGEMGIEYWSNVRDSSIRNNRVASCTFGISIDRNYHTSVTDNQVRLVSYAGIEVATGCNHCLVEGNTVNAYTILGARSGAQCYVSSNASCMYSRYIGNTAVGGEGGYHLEYNDTLTLQSNIARDCGALLILKGCNRVSVTNCLLEGPCGYHVFVDDNDANVTDLDISYNTFTGAAANDNIIIYDNNNGRTAANVRIAHNNVAAATWGNLSLNKQIPDSRMPNYQVYGNHYVAGGNNAAFPDYTTNASSISPYSSSMQGGGISVGCITTFTAPASGVDQWVMVYATVRGQTHYMPFSIEAYSEGVGGFSAVRGDLIGVPYGVTRSQILLWPTGDYGNYVKEVVYNGYNANHDLWIRLAANTNPTIVKCYFGYSTGGRNQSNVWFQTATPGWSSFNYRVLVDPSHSDYFRVDGLATRNFISCAPGYTDIPKARLYLKGAPGWAANNTIVVDNDSDSSVFIVDKEGNVTARSLTLTNAIASTAPYRASVQRAGISVSDMVPFVAPANAVDRWVKVFEDNQSGRAMVYKLHVTAHTNAFGDSQELSFDIASATYGQNCSITSYPAPGFGGVVAEVVYDNPANGPTHAIWLRLINSDVDFTVYTRISDSPTSLVPYPELVFTTPSFSPNSYRMLVRRETYGVSHVFRTHALQARNHFLLSSNAEATLQAKLHVQGADTSRGVFDLIARFDNAAGTRQASIDTSGKITANHYVLGSGKYLAPWADTGSDFYDDFARSDTAPGVLGRSASGSDWYVHNWSGDNPGVSSILESKWVCPSMPSYPYAVYASQELRHRVTRIGAKIGWTQRTEGTPGQYSTFALLLTDTQGAAFTNNCGLHVQVRRTEWVIQVIDNGEYFTIASGGYVGAMEMSGHAYTCEFELDGATLRYRIGSASGACHDTRFVSLGGNYATWEHYLPNGATEDLLQVISVWAGTNNTPSVGVYTDGTAIYSYGHPITAVPVEGSRILFAGPSGAIDFRSENGSVSLGAVVNSGEWSFPKYTNSVQALLSGDPAYFATNGIRGRLHLVDVGTVSGTTSNYSMVCIDAWNAEATAHEEVFSIDAYGHVHARCGLSIGNGWRVSQLGTYSNNIDYGTITANTTVGVNFYVPGVEVNPTAPASFAIGFRYELPDGIVMAYVRITASETGTLYLRNTTDSAIVVSWVWFTATAFYFAP